MTCEDAIRNLLTLDNHTEIDDSTHAHLKTCARCRAEQERLCDALSALPENNTPFGSPAWEAALTDTVMQAVHAQAWAEASAEDDTGWVEYGRWLGAGVLILFGMLALPYTDVLVAVRTLSNGEIDFALAVSFGLIITVYMALFVATNLNDLSRRLRRLGMLPVSSDPKTRHR